MADPRTHNVYVKTDGTLWAWGANRSGQLGLGDLESRNEPSQVGGASDWAAASVGAYFSVAIKDDGTLWAAGLNSLGQLGLAGSTSLRQTFVQIGSDSDWASVAAGGFHVLAVKTDGTLWAWGFGAKGQLGFGNTRDFSHPRQVGSDSDWDAVAAGLHHSLALKTGGTLWAWGDGNLGQVGYGEGPAESTSRPFSHPRQVGGDSDWDVVAAGLHASMAIKDDGTLWAWGDNGTAALGMGDQNRRSQPAQIGVDTDWIAAAAGSHHLLALKSGGTLWACGKNSFHQLGSTEPRETTLTQVGSDTDWSGIVSAGHAHTVATKGSNDLYGWGDNRYGSVGDGTNERRSAPTSIVV